MSDPFASIFAPAPEKPADASTQAPDPFKSIFSAAGEDDPAAGSAAPGDRYALGEVPGEAAKNFFPGLAKKVEDVATAATEHPMDMAQSLLMNTPFHPIGLVNYQINTVKNLIDRYGSWDKAKTTAAEDPSGFLMDLASFAPGVGSAGKAAGIPKIASGAEKTLQMIDPALAMTTLRKAATVGGKAAASVADHAVQALEGIGSGALKEMFESGKAATPGVWKTLTGGLDFEKSYDLIKSSLWKLDQDAKSSYLADMSRHAQAQQPVDFKLIDKAVGDAGEIGYYKAPGDARPGPGFKYQNDKKVDAARAEILAEIEKFRSMGPEYHTAIGFDKLKQDVQSIGEGLKEGMQPTSGTAFAGKIANAIKQTIINEVPEYGVTMKKYADAAAQRDQLIKEFSLQSGNKLATLRKLQKVWRQTADVAHGERTNVLREAVQQSGHPELMSHLAAGQFHPWLPRGLRGTFLPMEAMVNPSMLGTALPLQSPRIGGAAAYGLGRLSSSPLGRVPAASYDIAERAAPVISRTLRQGLPPQPQQEEPRGFFSR